MEKTMTLRSLAEGEKGCVISVDPALRELTDRLGLAAGTVIICLRRSPLGDPTAYWFRSTILALRAEAADRIRVCVIDSEQETDAANNTAFCRFSSCK